IRHGRQHRANPSAAGTASMSAPSLIMKTAGRWRRVPRNTFILAWLALAAAVTVIALPVPDAIKTRQKKAITACLTNIDEGVQEWALQDKKSRTELVTPPPDE